MDEVSARVQRNQQREGNCPMGISNPMGIIIVIVVYCSAVFHCSVASKRRKHPCFPSLCLLSIPCSEVASHLSPLPRTETTPLPRGTQGPKHSSLTEESNDKKSNKKNNKKTTEKDYPAYFRNPIKNLRMSIPLAAIFFLAEREQKHIIQKKKKWPWAILPPSTTPPQKQMEHKAPNRSSHISPTQLLRPFFPRLSGCAHISPSSVRDSFFPVLHRPSPPVYTPPKITCTIALVYTRFSHQPKYRTRGNNNR